jgi:4-carboxymuconolactone decarboxylase
MARIPGALRNQGGLIGRLFVGIVYSLTQRRLGRVIMPVQVTAHHPKILWGYGQMEQSQAGARLVDPKLKGLAELRVATLVGCPF